MRFARLTLALVLIAALMLVGLSFMGPKASAQSGKVIRFGVNPRWNSALRRSCFGGSMPMNIAWMSSSGMIASVSAVTPPADE